MQGNRYWREIEAKIRPEDYPLAKIVEIDGIVALIGPAPSIPPGVPICDYCGLVSSPIMEHRETRARLCKISCYSMLGLRRAVLQATRLTPSRAPSRTLVRVVAVVEGAYFYVVIPGWNYKKNVRVYFSSLPNKMRPLVDVGKRFHARVNVGAESIDELRFDSWEPE